MVQAIGRAIAFLEKSREPYGLLFEDVMWRRFGVTRFADALARYDQRLNTDSFNAPMRRIFRRIADHANVPQPGDEAAIVARVDQLTAPALYCDRTPLPADYGSRLDEANTAGAYLRTHALLSLQWLRENDCAPIDPPGYEAELIDAVATLIAPGDSVSDLELEAASFLYSYGRGDTVDRAIVAETLAQQNRDGGWLVSTNEDVGSDWHGSILALYLLLHAYCGERDYPPMLAPGPSPDRG